MGLYALSSNITMEKVMGEITYCQRIYDTHRNTSYWKASAKFFVDGNEYSGITMMFLGTSFLIPKIKNRRKIKKIFSLSYLT